jgi:hypothetical protein
MRAGYREDLQQAPYSWVIDGRYCVYARKAELKPRDLHQVPRGIEELKSIVGIVGRPPPPVCGSVIVSVHSFIKSLSEIPRYPCWDLVDHHVLAVHQDLDASVTTCGKFVYDQEQLHDNLYIYGRYGIALVFHGAFAHESTFFDRVVWA